MKSLHENICRPKHNPAQFSCTASFPKNQLETSKRHTVADIINHTIYSLQIDSRVNVFIGAYCQYSAIVNSVVKNSYYGILRGLISRYLPPKHLIIAIWIKIKMAAVLTKRSPLNNIICSFRKAFGPQFFPKETSNPNKELYYQQKILVITN